MKFNKSAESDHYYVEREDGDPLGIIRKSSFVNGYHFEQNRMHVTYSMEMKDITKFMLKLERESGIDTTSTFTTNNIGD